MVSGAACPPGRFVCNTGSRVQCAEKCNNIPECDGGEDEEDCEGILPNLDYSVNRIENIMIFIVYTI